MFTHWRSQFWFQILDALVRYKIMTVINNNVFDFDLHAANLV